MKSQQIQEISSGYEQEIASLRSRIDKSNELLKQSRSLIESFKQKNNVDDAMISSNCAGLEYSAPALVEDQSYQQVDEEQTSHHSKDDSDFPFFQSISSLPIDERVDITENNDGVKLPKDISAEQYSNERNYVIDKNVEKKNDVGKRTRKLSSNGSSDDTKGKEVKRHRILKKKKHSLSKRYDNSSDEESDQRPQKIEKTNVENTENSERYSDEKNNEMDENVEKKNEVEKRSRKPSLNGSSDDTKENVKRHKKFNKKHSSSKKYVISSDEDADQRPEKIKKKNEKNRYSRASDDEYSSDFFDPPNRVDFKSYMNKKGTKMFHLKHDVTITYKSWDELKRTNAMKDYMRILLHSIYDENQLRTKVFNVKSCKSERIPGETRTQFSRRKIAAIRKTFFHKVELTFKDKQDRYHHRNNWKVYISEHVNALVEKEERCLMRQERAEKRKRDHQETAADDNDSLTMSSDDEAQ